MLKRLVRNTGYLFSANVVVAILGIFTLTIMARALGPAGFGILVLIEAYARVIDRFLRFEPWQAMIRFGADALERGRDNDFHQLIKASTLFDIFGATLSAIVAMASLHFVGPWLKFNAEEITMAQAFSASLIFSLSATPKAVLRLFDQFGTLAKISVSIAMIRFLLAATAWVLGGNLWYFVALLILHQLIQNLAMLAFAWRELDRQNHKGVWRTPLEHLFEKHPGILKFIWNSNVNVIARASTRRFDTIIVGIMLNPAAAGFYQLSQRISIALVRLGAPLQQAVYPDIARLWSRGDFDAFRRTVMFVNITVGVIAALCVAIASLKMDFLVPLAFGNEFAAAAPLIIIQLIGVAIFMLGISLSPALLSMGADEPLVKITLSATVAFFVGLVPLVYVFGAIGAAINHLVLNLIWLFGCTWFFLARTTQENVRQSVGQSPSA